MINQRRGLFEEVESLKLLEWKSSVFALGLRSKQSLAHSPSLRFQGRSTYPALYALRWALILIGTVKPL